MKKIVVLILCLLLLFLCGCKAQEERNDNQNNTPIVVMPDDNTKATVNGYKKPPVVSEPTENKADNDTVINGYVGNKSTKKFHISSCQYAKKIKEENFEASKLRSHFSDNGYTACKKCNP